MARPGNKTVFIDATLHLHVEYECTPESGQYCPIPTDSNKVVIQHIPVTVEKVIKKIEKRIKKLLDEKGLDPHTITIEVATQSTQVTPVFTEEDDIRDVWIAKEKTETA